MIIRAYMGADEQSVIKLWNVALKADIINRENFYNRIIFDANFDPALFLVAEGNGELQGFVYGTKRRVPDETLGLEPNNAWIVAMGVLPRARRKGIGSALVRALEQALKQDGASDITLGAYSANYIFPGVDNAAYEDAVGFFKSLGYEEKGTCASMNLCLQNYEIPAKYMERQKQLESDGYVFTPFKKELYLPMADFFRIHFPSWLQIVRKNVLEGRGEESIQLAIAPDKQVIGFAMRAMDGTPGRFGPFGVDPSMQGTGIGGVIFHSMMADMMVRRIFFTWFLWTGGRNLDIYAAWGMKVFRNYAVMGRQLA